MERRYDDLLTSHLESVLDEGCTYIAWGALYRWYGVEKIAAGTYRDLESRWQEVSKGTKLGRLLHIPNEGGTFLLAEKSVKPISPD